VVLVGGDDCPPPGGTANPGALSPEAKKAIPPGVAEVYVAMAARWNLDVAFLASIGAQATDHGRHPATNQVTAAGCQGLMQLGTGAACGDYWGRNQCDGNRDGRMRITDAWDNVCAAAAACDERRALRPLGAQRPVTTRRPATTTAPAPTARPPTPRR
jgi:hypothetical protein